MAKNTYTHTVQTMFMLIDGGKARFGAQVDAELFLMKARERERERETERQRDSRLALLFRKKQKQLSATDHRESLDAKNHIPE